MDKALGEAHIAQREGLRKERSDLRLLEPGDPTPDFRHEKVQLPMRFGKGDEFVYIGLDGLHSAVHGGNAVGLALKPDPLAPNGAEVFESRVGRSAAVRTFEVAAEDKDFTGGKGGDSFCCDATSEVVWKVLLIHGFLLFLAELGPKEGAGSSKEVNSSAIFLKGLHDFRRMPVFGERPESIL